MNACKNRSFRPNINFPQRCKSEKEDMMQAFSVEQSIIKGDNQVKKLFDFVQKHAE